MLFEKALTVPAGTLKTAPAEVDIDICPGVITRISVEFNYGPNYLVSAYVRQALHQIWPLNPEGAVKSDGLVVSSQEFDPVPEPPYILTCGAYSPGCTYDHEIYFHIEITPEAEALKNQAFLSWGEKIMRVLGLK
jgi:hypothetical protein